jgi:hypothetical protein
VTYHRNMVICTYRALHPDKLELSDERIEQFDKTLKNKFDEELRKQADENGIDPNKFNLSMLVYFSALSTATMVVTQVKHGCKFFLSTQPQP